MPAIIVAISLAIISAALASPVVLAAPLPLPGAAHGARVVDKYPSQMPRAGIGAVYSPGTAGFLTLPYLGDGHFISSNFDHCGPNYSRDGMICRFDGTVAYAGNGSDPDAPTGYAMSAGKDDFLYYDGHDGVDMGLYYEPVVAAADGRVTYSDWSTPGCTRCSFGKGVRIDHGNGFDTLYGHLWRIDAVVGQSVRRGQVIGISGTTGASTGEHLHFGVYHHGTWDPVDPFGWSGPGADPWSHDNGNLWQGGAARSPNVTVPTIGAGVATTGPDDSDLLVSWSSPAATATYDVVQFTDDQAGVPLVAGVGAGSLTVHAQVGHRYWFKVSAVSALGHTDAMATTAIRLVGVPAQAR
jgi:hypothetical protein